MASELWQDEGERDSAAQACGRIRQRQRPVQIGAQRTHRGSIDSIGPLSIRQENSMPNDDLLDRIWDSRRRLNANEGQPMRTDDDDKFLRLLCRMRELHDAKSADYGDGMDAYSNFRRSARLGVSPFLGCLVRLNDKVERVIQLSQHE